MSVRLRVVVLMGGPSAEHEVSLNSGRGVVNALIRRGFTTQAVTIPRDLQPDEAGQFTKDTLQRVDADGVFIALHGTFGEDGAVQQVCEELHLPYTGSDVAASRLGMDKIDSRAKFKQARLTVPRSYAVSVRSPVDQIAREIGYPLVVKPANQGSSVGVSIIFRSEQLTAALDEAGSYGEMMVIEEFLEGRELTVGVLGEQALPIVEILPKRRFFDFTAKYTVGATDYQVPALLSAEIKHSVAEAGLRAHEAVGCRHFSRTDLILSEEHGPVILEVNTIPGLTPTSLLPKSAASIDISYDSLCEQIVLMACHEKRPVLGTSVG